ncbi:molybdopterin binding oxidoreductase [Wolfiporia cocos MD-104 SS10]|uniref:Molybdopterin binding oxidoreductase n=1 Tax=Wolfiporia cocos (strain MD-104) TaxID=742152 RepID=A0A2H3JJ50_WOLCO|nr:molybdopterin binding oxidoreductase [Wolfiporia cocos MD-104 SS10]
MSTSADILAPATSAMIQTPAPAEPPKPHFPMDFTLEHETIAHSDLLLVCAHEPFNAEPTAAALVEFPVTPNELVYCRNHGPVQEYDYDAFAITVRVRLGKGPNGDADEEQRTQGSEAVVERTFTAKEIREQFEKVEVEAALQCAGNRRKEMSKLQPVVGVLWDDGVVANCVWGGTRLRDVLVAVGVQHPALYDPTSISTYADAPVGPSGLHVHLNSRVTACQDDAYYGASIPLEKALQDEVLLAYEMNSEPLYPDRGGPLRAVVPGFLGARWVKWIDEIEICTDESENYYQRRDYRILPPEIDSRAKAASAWPLYPSMTSLPLNSVVASLTRTSPTSLLAKGYAVGRGACPVTRVQVSVDGERWADARITYSGGAQSGKGESRWSWTLWAAIVSGEEVGEGHHGTVWCRAIDEAGNVQQQRCPWNYRGVGYCPWGAKSF